LEQRRRQLAGKRIPNRHLPEIKTGRQFILYLHTSLGEWVTCLNVEDDYVEVWCAPSASQVLCVHKSQTYVMGMIMFVVLRFERRAVLPVVGMGVKLGLSREGITQAVDGLGCNAGEIVLGGGKQQEAGENYILWSFVICNPRKIVRLTKSRGMSWMGHVARKDRGEGCIQGFGGET
jgi:hypothetical protein